MLNEFKEFIARGNVMDMAVGIIMGAAFTAIVTSMVDDLMNPIIAIFTGGIDFSGLKVPLTEAADGPAFNYGNFIMAVINFLIVAWVVFLLVKGVNRMKRMMEAEAAEKEKEPEGPTEKDLLMEIRDAMVAQNQRQTPAE
ncbi:MAG: large-conductance mechanosensitive channel protein MscL [Pseudomonadota bacterium]